MFRLLWVLAGFVIGVTTSRNAEPMSDAQISAVLVFGLVGFGLFWWAGSRDKASAVATAVAVAVAKAEANAEAHATSVAQQAVQVYLGLGSSEPKAALPHHVFEQVDVRRSVAASSHLIDVAGDATEAVEV